MESSYPFKTRYPYPQTMGSNSALGSDSEWPSTSSTDTKTDSQRKLNCTSETREYYIDNDTREYIERMYQNAIINSRTSTFDPTAYLTQIKQSSTYKQYPMDSKEEELFIKIEKALHEYQIHPTLRCQANSFQLGILWYEHNQGKISNTLFHNLISNRFQVLKTQNDKTNEAFSRFEKINGVLYERSPSDVCKRLHEKFMMEDNSGTYRICMERFEKRLPGIKNEIENASLENGIKKLKKGIEKLKLNGQIEECAPLFESKFHPELDLSSTHDVQNPFNMFPDVPTTPPSKLAEDLHQMHPCNAKVASPETAESLRPHTVKSKTQESVFGNQEHPLSKNMLTRMVQFLPRGEMSDQLSPETDLRKIMQHSLSNYRSMPEIELIKKKRKSVEKTILKMHQESSQVIGKMLDSKADSSKKMPFSSGEALKKIEAIIKGYNKEINDYTACKLSGKELIEAYFESFIPTIEKTIQQEIKKTKKFISFKKDPNRQKLKESFKTFVEEAEALRVFALESDHFRPYEPIPICIDKNEELDQNLYPFNFEENRQKSQSPPLLIRSFITLMSFLD